MATARKKTAKSKADLELISSQENFLIEKEKRYQKKIKGPQVEKLTTLKETKKKAAPKARAKSAKKR